MNEQQIADLEVRTAAIAREMVRLGADPDKVDAELATENSPLAEALADLYDLGIEHWQKYGPAVE